MASGSGHTLNSHAGTGAQLRDTDTDVSTTAGTKPAVQVDSPPDVPAGAVDNKTVVEKNSSAAEGPTLQVLETEASSAKEDLDLCAICFEGQRETALAPCGHRALCRYATRLMRPCENCCLLLTSNLTLLRAHLPLYADTCKSENDGIYTLFVAAQRTAVCMDACLWAIRDPGAAVVYFACQAWITVLRAHLQHCVQSPCAEFTESYDCC